MKRILFPKKTLFFIFFLIIIILFLVFFPKKTPPTENPPSPKATSLEITPSFFPQGDIDILEKQEGLRKNQYPLLDFTPYQTKDFLITYIGPLYLKITIFGENKEKSQKEALLWIKEKGIEPQSHRIKWEGL